jgi:hypothetical protein
MVTAMTGQCGHALRIFAVRRTVLLARWGHTGTSHVSAFGGSVRHRDLQRGIAPVFRSADILLASCHRWSSREFVQYPEPYAAYIRTAGGFTAWLRNTPGDCTRTPG